MKYVVLIGLMILTSCSQGDSYHRSTYVISKSEKKGELPVEETPAPLP